MNEAIKQDQKNYKKEINREVRLEKKKQNEKNTYIRTKVLCVPEQKSFYCVAHVTYYTSKIE